MKKNLLIAILLVANTINAQLKIDTALEENFKDNSNGWLLYNEENKLCEIKNGTLYFNNKTSKNKWSHIETNLNLNEDFIIETSIKLISGTNNNVLSLIINKKENQFYDEFGFSDNGYWLYRRVIEQEFNAESGWQKVDYIKQGDYNKITILKLNKKVFFLINNKPVLVKKDINLSFKGLAIKVCRKAEVEADYIKAGYYNASKQKKETYGNDLETQLKQAKKENENVIIENSPVLNLETSFNKNEFGFHLSETEQNAFTINNGGLDLKTFSKSYHQTWADIKINPNHDFDLSTTLKKISGVDNKAISLIVQKNKHFLQFAYSNNGYWLSILQKGEKTISKIPWKKTSLIKKSDNNTLRIKKIENSIYFILNDKVLNKWRHKQLGNTIYIKVPDTAHVRVDNVKLTQTYRSKKEQDLLITKFDNLWNIAKTENIGAIGKTTEQEARDSAEREKNRKKILKESKRLNKIFKGAPLSEVLKKYGQPYKSNSVSVSYKYKDDYDGRKRELTFVHLPYEKGKLKYRMIDHVAINYRR